MSETRERSPEEIREDIEETREDLGETAAAVADKADVQKQAKKQVSGAKQKASAKVEEVKETASAKKDEVTGKAQEATPASAQDGAEKVRQFAQENPIPVAAGGAFVVGFLIGKLTSR